MTLLFSALTEMVTQSRSRPSIDLDEPLVAFFGLYSGDGAKGTEAPVDQLRASSLDLLSRRNPTSCGSQSTTSGSSSLATSASPSRSARTARTSWHGEGLEPLKAHYGGRPPSGSAAQRGRPDAERGRPEVSARRYGQTCRAIRPTTSPSTTSTSERWRRSCRGQAQDVMCQDRPWARRSRYGVTSAAFQEGCASSRGNSRSDEIHVGGLNGIGELFLKMFHDIEETLLLDSQTSTSGLVEWYAMSRRRSGGTSMSRISS